MTMILNQNVYLTDWQALPIEGGIVLLYEHEKLFSLIRITDHNEVNTLLFNYELEFDQGDAWLVAQVLPAIKTGWDGDRWQGEHALLPIAFDKEQVPDALTLAALAFCHHSAKRTLIQGDAEQGFLYHIHFGGKCWFVSLTEELELDYIMQI